ncbi:RNA methyltransferase [Candidatus Roizmanbacteria bacterium]|nr:RNA methyltransferase [Candidatus Roizmanbacteria bacterium]
MKLNARQLREVSEKEISDKLKGIKRRPIYFILENVYDTYNVGGLFRLADAIGVAKLYLCGEMETPPNHKIKKASIGTYKIVPWEYRQSVKEAIEELRQNYKIQIIAVEQDKNSVSYAKADYSLPVALIFGNETYGVHPETLKLVDQIVEIPMWGVNKSLNVIVSAAIVSYHMVGTSAGHLS